MQRSESVVVIALVTLSLVLAGAAYQLGRSRGHRDVYRTQAILAFAHYRFYASIADDLEKMCYEVALAEAKGHRDEQIVLFADNLRKTGNDPGLLAYFRLREPALLKSVLSGHTPELRSFSTTCGPAP